VPGDGVFPEIEQGFVSCHARVRFAIQDGDGAGVFVLFLIEPGNQLVKLLQIPCILLLAERVNHYWMNPASRRAAGISGRGLAFPAGLICRRFLHDGFESFSNSA
jgi:hypothetical protein